MGMSHVRDVDKKTQQYVTLRLHVLRVGTFIRECGPDSGCQASYRSGASIDRAKGVRTVDQVRKRGRRISDTSVRRYEKMRATDRELAFVDPAQKAYIEECERRLDRNASWNQSAALVVLTKTDQAASRAAKTLRVSVSHGMGTVVPNAVSR